MQAAAYESPRFYYLGGFAKDRLAFISRQALPASETGHALPYIFSLFGLCLASCAFRAAVSAIHKTMAIYKKAI